MGWSYRDPKTFPAVFYEGVREAIKYPGKPILTYSSQSRSDAQAKAEMLRWWKWCLKAKPGMDIQSERLLDGFTIRSTVSTSLSTHSLYITAREARLGDIRALNPELIPLLDHEGS